jgi:hypothetical protein
MVALVINGDLVDFLAEADLRDKNRPRVCFDSAGAPEKLARIMREEQEPRFAGVWRGLKKFVRTANRHLIVILGITTWSWPRRGSRSSSCKSCAGMTATPSARSRGMPTFWPCDRSSIRRSPSLDVPQQSAPDGSGVPKTHRDDYLMVLPQATPRAI